MKSTVLLCAFAICAASAANAQEIENFPLEVGTTWNYELTITRGEKSHSIRYRTEIVRKESLDGVECLVFESRSGTKLLRTSWYQREGGVIREWRTSSQGGALVQKLRTPGPEGEEEPARGRVLLDSAKTDPGMSWPWTTVAGDASGTIAVLGTNELSTPALGVLNCLQIEEQGEFRRGDKTAKQVRNLWFAPKLGLVREVSRITLPDGRETTSETILLNRPKANK